MENEKTERAYMKGFADGWVNGFEALMTYFVEIIDKYSPNTSLFIKSKLKVEEYIKDSKERWDKDIDMFFNDKEKAMELLKERMKHERTEE